MLLPIWELQIALSFRNGARHNFPRGRVSNPFKLSDPSSYFFPPFLVRQYTCCRRERGEWRSVLSNKEKKVWRQGKHIFLGNTYFLFFLSSFVSFWPLREWIRKLIRLGDPRPAPRENIFNSHGAVFQGKSGVVGLFLEIYKFSPFPFVFTCGDSRQVR